MGLICAKPGWGSGGPGAALKTTQPMALSLLGRFLAEPVADVQSRRQLLLSKRRDLSLLERRLTTEEAVLVDLEGFKRTQDEIVQEINFSLLKIPRMESRL